MAITAHFGADFTAFTTAVNNAELKLKGFQTDAAKVQASLNRIGDSFSGRKLISEATLAVKAVEQIGGVTKLTAAEQAKLNTQVTQAIAKYHALGQEAPKDLLAIEKATRQGSGALVTFGKDVAGIAAGFLTAQAAIAGLRTVVRAVSDELKVLTIGGAAVDDVTENFEHLTQASGRLGSTLLTALRTGTHGTIADFQLIKLASQDLTAGLELTDDQFAALARGAFALAQATGGDVATGLETMNDAMLTGRTRALALLTGKIDLEQAEIKYARSLGTTRDHLSDEGKLEAARAAILESVAAATARLGDQTDGLDEKLAQAAAAWANFQNELGRTVASSPVILAALDGIGEALTTAFGDQQGAVVAGIAKKIDEAAIALVEFAKVGVTAAGFLYKEFIALNKLLGNTAQIFDGVRLALLGAQRAAVAAQGDFKNFGVLTQQIDSLMDTMAARGKLLQDEDRQQGKVDETTQAYLRTLDDLIARMKAAQSATDDGTAATNRSSGARQRNTGLLRENTAEIERALAAEIKMSEEMRRQADFAQSWARYLSLNIRQLGGLADVLERGRVALLPEGGQGVASGLLPGGEINRELFTALAQYPGQAAGIGAKTGFDFTESLIDNLKPLRTRIPNIITDAFTGGGGLKGSLKAIGVQLANAFLQSFIDELISARGSIKKALAGLFGGGAAKAAGAAGGGGVIAAIGSAIGIGGAPTQKAPENKVPVATNEPQPPAATVITTPTTPSPGQPGYPGGSVTQSILTGGFRSRTTTAAAAPNVTNHNVVNLTIETPDAASFDRSWERQIVPRLHRELFTNALGTVTEINRIVAVKR